MHVFTWRIKNFSMCPEKKFETLKSPTFKAKSMFGTTWCLELKSSRVTKTESYILFFITRITKESAPTKLEWEFLFEIIDQNGGSLKSFSEKRRFDKEGFAGYAHFITRDEVINTALHEDTLTIRCQIKADIPGKKICSQNFCTTTITTNKLSLQWRVKNLNSFDFGKALLYLESSQIVMIIDAREDDIKIDILVKKTKIPSNCVDCECILIDTEGKERARKREKHLFQPGERWEFPTFIKKSQLNANKDKYLKNDCFRLIFNFIVADGTKSTQVVEMDEHSRSVKSPTTGIEDTLAVWNKDIRSLHEDEIPADVKLKVDNQIFLAHKSVLSVRSSVFFAMFNSDTDDSQKEEVDIPDLDSETADLLLKFMYTGIVTELDCEKALKLMVAAEKYDVQALKHHCARVLSWMLSDENVCEILFAANLVHHDTLKAFVFDYIKKKPDEIFYWDEWKHYVKNNLDLATETVCEVSKFLGDLTIK